MKKDLLERKQTSNIINAINSGYNKRKTIYEFTTKKCGKLLKELVDNNILLNNNGTFSIVDSKIVNVTVNVTEYSSNEICKIYNVKTITPKVKEKLLEDGFIIKKSDKFPFSNVYIK